LIVELNLSDQAEYRNNLRLLKECGFRLASQGDIQGTPSESAANHLFERCNIAEPAASDGKR
jgi:hypothetical protein